MQSQVLNSLRTALKAREERRAVLPINQLATNYDLFRSRFGKDALSKYRDQDLLLSMHARGNKASLAYWLEFKNDDEFRGKKFGSISGGSAHKFGLFQRESGQWVKGGSRKEVAITEAAAIVLAEKQRDQLLACASLLEALPRNANDEQYERLQENINKAAPDVGGLAWVHKYLSLLFPDKLDDFHNEQWQRFHLIKLLVCPSEVPGLYANAGRFVRLAAELGWPINHLASACNERNGKPVRYWRIGTRLGQEDEYIWPLMSEHQCVAIGWSEIGDLTALMGQEGSREAILKSLELHYYANDARTASRKAGEIDNFVNSIGVRDVVVAADGQRVLGIGRVSGEYYHDEAGSENAPHRLPVEWLAEEEWDMPVFEGKLTTVCQIGKHAENLLEIERRLLGVDEVRPEARGVRRKSKELEGQGEFDATDESDARDKIERAIACRRGQQTFRAALLEAYDSRCVITGCDAVEALEAAHIKPYRGEHTNHVQNGLLLRADLHTLFDLGYIKIDPESLRVVLDPRLSGTHYAAIQNIKVRDPKNPLHKPSNEALRHKFRE